MQVSSTNIYKSNLNHKSLSFTSTIYLCTKDEFDKAESSLKPSSTGKNFVIEDSITDKSTVSKDATSCTIGSISNKKESYTTHLIPDKSNIGNLHKIKQEINRHINEFISKTPGVKPEGFIAGGKPSWLDSFGSCYQLQHSQELVETIMQIFDDNKLNYTALAMQSGENSNVSVIADGNKNIFYVLALDDKGNAITTAKSVRKNFRLRQISRNDKILNSKGNITKKIRKKSLSSHIIKFLINKKILKGF